MGFVEASRKDWLGGRQFDVGRYLHGATLEETVATGVYCLVTGKRRDSNVYFVQSGETWVLVDTAWRGRAELIRSAAETLFGAGARPRAIVLTHVHPDHAGSASELARMWDVTVYVHPGELPLPPSGRIIGALARVERRWMFPSGQDGLSPIDPDAGVPGLPDWQVIPTPGHTPGHLALFREADRTLIAGDAVLTVNLNSPGDALSQRHTLGGPPRCVHLSFLNPETQLSSRGNRRYHVHRLPFASRDDDRGLPDGRPRGPGVVVGPYAGLICEEDTGTLLGCQFADPRVSGFLPFLHTLRILLISAVQRPLRRQPYLVQQPADLDLRELDTEFPPDQLADDLPRPQPEIELQLPRIAPGDNRVQLRQLGRTQTGSRPWCLLRLQRDRAALVVFLLPPEQHRPGNIEHSRHHRRFVSLFEKLNSLEPLFRCRTSPFQCHKHNISGGKAGVYKPMN